MRSVDPVSVALFTESELLLKVKALVVAFFIPILLWVGTGTNAYGHYMYTFDVKPPLHGRCGGCEEGSLVSPA